MDTRNYHSAASGWGMGAMLFGVFLSVFNHAHDAISPMITRGAAAEQAAADYLTQQGLVLVTRNFRCRLGEIDLIMRDGKTLVFVEVRARASREFGGAAASIDSRKQHKLIATANMYLTTISPTPPCRFDAVLMEGGGLQWLQNAFQV